MINLSRLPPSFCFNFNKSSYHTLSKAFDMSTNTVRVSKERLESKLRKMSCVISSFSSQQRQTVHWKLGFERCYYILAKEKQVCNLKQFIFFFYVNWKNVCFFQSLAKIHAASEFWKIINKQRRCNKNFFTNEKSFRYRPISFIT